MNNAPLTEEPAYTTGITFPSWAWKLYQLAVFLFFVFGDIYFEWHMGGLASGVLGGMVAWYSSAILGHFLSKVPRRHSVAKRG